MVDRLGKFSKMLMIFEVLWAKDHGSLVDEMVSQKSVELSLVCAISPQTQAL